MEPQQGGMSGKQKTMIFAGISLILIVLLIGVTFLISKQKSKPINGVPFAPSSTISARKQGAIEAIRNKIGSIPIVTSDFVLAVNPTSKEITLTKKTPQADEAVKAWLQANKLPDVLYSTQLTYKEMATKVLAWLDKTRVYGDKLDNPTATGEYISNGGYAFGQFCGDNLICRDLAPGNFVGLYGIWARFKSYESDKDPAALAILQKDIETYADQKSISVIQPQTWAFKLMYELWKSPLLTSEQKKTIETILYRIQHNPEVILPIEQVIQQKGTIAEIDIPLFQKGFYNKDDGIVYTDRLNTYAAYSSEHLYTYLYAKESGLGNPEQYLYIARGLFNNAVRSYVKYGLKTSDDPALLGIAALDMYNFTQNKQYLDFASFLYEKHMANTTCQGMNTCATMLYFTDILNKIAPDQKKSDKIKKTIGDLYMQKFDYEGTDGYQLGVGAFYDLDMKLTKNTSYELVPNALIVDVLLESK